LIHLQEVTGTLPLNNIQGIVSVGELQIIDSTNDIVGDALESIIDVYPNPSNGNNITIDFDLQEQSDYVISILGVNGAVVANSQPLSGRGKIGKNTVRIDNLTLDSGIYLIKLDAQGGSFTQRLIIEK